MGTRKWSTHEIEKFKEEIEYLKLDIEDTKSPAKKREFRERIKKLELEIAFNEKKDTYNSNK